MHVQRRAEPPVVTVASGKEGFVLLFDAKERAGVVELLGVCFVVEADGAVTPGALEHRFCHVHHHHGASEGLLDDDQVTALELIRRVVAAPALRDHLKPTGVGERIHFEQFGKSLREVGSLRRLWPHFRWFIIGNNIFSLCLSFVSLQSQVGTNDLKFDFVSLLDRFAQTLVPVTGLDRERRIDAVGTQLD
jgi:hypothetical protein